MKRLILTAAMMAHILVSPNNPALADKADLERQLRDVLEHFRAEHGFPGATATIMHSDGESIDAAVGWADVENQVPMTPRTRMLAASIGKTLVGALVLALESEGEFHRDDLVSLYLGGRPWFDRLPNSGTITIQHLLNHTSGLPDHVHVEGIGPELIALGLGRTFNAEDAIAFVLDKEPLFEAGSAWSYTDTGYLLLGLVIEAATERDFYDLVSTYFLKPLGLTQTIPSNTRQLDGLAVGYTNTGNAFGLAARTMNAEGLLTWNPAVEWTGGGFASTSHELAFWGQVLFSGRVIDLPYLDRLLEGVPVHPDLPNTLYGNGVGIYAETDLGPVYGHGGWIPGYVSSLRHYSDHHVTIAFQINSDIGVADDSANFVPELEVALAAITVMTGNDQ